MSKGLIAQVLKRHALFVANNSNQDKKGARKWQLYIPGASSLGYGFDVFGRYSDSSKTRPLFNMVYDGKQTYNDYLVPLNVNVENKRHNYGNSTYVDTREKIEQHFAANLMVAAKHGFFSGQFETSYNKQLAQR